jgi:hypothetical protein
MHDTTLAMPCFGELVLAHVPPAGVVARPLRCYPSMSMGYYSLPALYAATQAILATKSEDTSVDGRMRAKNAPGLEDMVFRMLLWGGPANWESLNGDAIIGTFGGDSPFGGTVRIRETYPVPGLYKFKANWGQSAVLRVDM